MIGHVTSIRLLRVNNRGGDNRGYVILRTIASLEAEKFRLETEQMIADCYKDIGDFCVVEKAMPAQEVKFVPCREGKSLYSPVKRRSIPKRHTAGRLAGVNGGKNVTFYED